MNRMLKVFATGAEQDRLVRELDVLERYDAFVVAEVPQAVAKKIAREHLVEDITDQYRIPVSAGTIDTSAPRIDAGGVTRRHPAYPRGSSHLVLIITSSSS